MYKMYIYQSQGVHVPMFDFAYLLEYVTPAQF